MTRSVNHVVDTFFLSKFIPKVIIHKLHGGVSLVEQDSIGLFKILYYYFKNKMKFFYLHFMQSLSVDNTICLNNLKKNVHENMNKPLLKVAYNWPHFFF